MSRRVGYTVSAATGARRRRKPAQAPSLPFGAGSVMAGHAGQVVADDDELTALRRSLNLFATPPWAARAGGEIIAALDPLARSCWEPACGLGHMAGALTDYFPGGVFCSDVHDHGGVGGRAGWARRILDFTGPEAVADDLSFDWVVTNPPFSRGAEFAAQGRKVARRGVALLCRLAFVESEGRHALMRELTLQAPFCERAPMQLGGWDPDLSSATAYAWFIWMTPQAVAQSPLRAPIEAARAAGGHLTRLIPPGTRERLWRDTDREIWGEPEAEAAGREPDAQLELPTAGGA